MYKLCYINLHLNCILSISIWYSSDCGGAFGPTMSIATKLQWDPLDVRFTRSNRGRQSAMDGSYEALRGWRSWIKWIEHPLHMVGVSMCLLYWGRYQTLWGLCHLLWNHYCNIVLITTTSYDSLLRKFSRKLLKHLQRRECWFPMLLSFELRRWIEEELYPDRTLFGVPCQGAPASFRLQCMRDPMVDVL